MSETGLPGQQPGGVPLGTDPNTQPQDYRPEGQEGTEPDAAGVPLTPQTNDPVQKTQPGYPSDVAEAEAEVLKTQAENEESGEPVQTDTENFAADPNPRQPREKDPAEGWRRNKAPREGESGEASPAVDPRLPNP